MLIPVDENKVKFIALTKSESEICNEMRNPKSETTIPNTTDAPNDNMIAINALCFLK